MKIETSTPIISDFVCSQMYRRGMKRVRGAVLNRILTFTLTSGNRIIFGNNNIKHQKISYAHTQPRHKPSRGHKVSFDFSETTIYRGKLCRE